MPLLGFSWPFISYLLSGFEHSLCIVRVEGIYISGLHGWHDCLQIFVYFPFFIFLDHSTFRMNRPWSVCRHLKWWLSCFGVDEKFTPTEKWCDTRPVFSAPNSWCRLGGPDGQEHSSTREAHSVLTCWMKYLFSLADTVAIAEDCHLQYVDSRE